MLDAIREAIASPREFAASFAVLVLMYAAVLAVLFAVQP